MKKIKYITLILSIVCVYALISDLVNGKSVWWNTGLNIIPSVDLSALKLGQEKWKAYGYPGSDALMMPADPTDAQSAIAYSSSSSSSDRDYHQSGAAGMSEATLVSHNNVVADGETRQQIVIAVGGLVAKSTQDIVVNNNELFSSNNQRFLSQTMTTELTHPGGAPVGDPIDNVPIGSEHCLYFIIACYCILRYKKQLFSLITPFFGAFCKTLYRQFAYIKENDYLCNIKKMWRDLDCLQPQKKMLNSK